MLEALSDDIDFMDLLTEDETENESHLHHEDTKAFEDRFRKDVSLLYDELCTRGNPFLQAGEELENIHSKSIMSPESAKSVRDAFVI